MKTFKDLEFTRDPFLDGVVAEMSFPNGFGVSVVCHKGSYGGETGLYELAVLRGLTLCYDTPVTNDVEGWLTPDKVTELMQQVQGLLIVSIDAADQQGGGTQGAEVPEVPDA